MNGERIVAGLFCGVGAILLIYRGNVAEGCAILGAMVGFFVGEANGKRATTQTAEKTA